MVCSARRENHPSWPRPTDTGSRSFLRTSRRPFRVDAVTTKQEFEATALGDQIVFTTQLLKGDTEVGHQGGVCTVTSVQRKYEGVEGEVRVRAATETNPTGILTFHLTD